MTTELEDPRIRETLYVVEATSQERHALWLEWSAEALTHGWGTPSNQRVPWNQEAFGCMVGAGTLAGFPVNMDFTWARINGVLVLFWYGCSRVVDSEMCEAWLRKHVPAFATARTNATNFAHCLAFIRRASRT